MLKNETKNSELFRALLRSLNYDKNTDIKVEEQKSDKKIIRNEIMYYMSFLKEEYNANGVASSRSAERDYKLIYFKQNKNLDKVERLSIERKVIYKCQ